MCSKTYLRHSCGCIGPRIGDTKCTYHLKVQELIEASPPLIRAKEIVVNNGLCILWTGPDKYMTDYGVCEGCRRAEGEGRRREEFLRGEKVGGGEASE
jgi:hypothetical protein